jgi:AcrR family transcriptional regulator
VSEPVKRRYDSSRRAERAAATRRAVLGAARDLFSSRGYAATTVADVADSAGVNVDTVYASVGRKPQLILGVIDMTLASSDEPLAAEQRDYVLAVLAARGARAKLVTYAEALGRVMPRVAPLFEALAQAAATDPECANVRDAIRTRRAAHMLTLAEDLRSTDEVRRDLTTQEVADLLWITNAPEHYALTVARGWSAEQYAERLADLWVRLLLT